MIILILEWKNIKISLIYFSGTGNTWWVMNKIKEKLEEKNCIVTVHSIESNFIKNIKEVQGLITQSDIIGFGYPIYGSDIPPFYMDFIKSLDSYKGKKAFVFTTMMYFSGDGAIVAKRILQKRGFKVRQAINIRMPNNLKLPYPIFRSFPIHNGEENNRIKGKALKKTTKLCERIISNKRWIQGADPLNIIGGLMQRVEMRFFDISVYARNYFVDEKTCTQCMQCVDYCPTKNIVFNDEKFTWENRCTLCLRCYNFCPEDAIQYKKATLNRKKYLRYKGPGNGFIEAKLKE